MGTRRDAREYALQMLFQWEFTKDSYDRIALHFWEHHDEPAAIMDFTRSLVEGTIRNLEEIDTLIQKHADNWRMDRMATVDRNVLRLAVYEFLHDQETPKNVVINEAIEIVRKFGAQESSQFINGILDGIKKELE